MRTDSVPMGSCSRHRMQYFPSPSDVALLVIDAQRYCQTYLIPDTRRSVYLRVTAENIPFRVFTVSSFGRDKIPIPYRANDKSDYADTFSYKRSTHRTHSGLSNRRICLSNCKDPPQSLPPCNNTARILKNSADDCRQHKGRYSRLLISQSYCKRLCTRTSIDLMSNDMKMGQLQVGNRASASVPPGSLCHSIVWHRWTVFQSRSSLDHTMSMSTVSVSDTTHKAPPSV
jgi:hypothetical protein